MDDETRSFRQLRLRKLLRTIRKERGVTQVDLASQLAVPQSVVSKYENGERQLDFVEVEEILGALGVSLWTFCKRLEAIK